MKQALGWSLGVWVALLVMMVNHLGMAQAANGECEICEYFVGGVETWVSQSASVAEIMQWLDAACEIAPFDRQECQAFVVEYVPELVRLLESSVPPAEACFLAGLCGPYVIHVTYMAQAASNNGQGPTNYLFRGGNPVVNQNGTFSMEGLQSALSDAAKSAGISLPADYVVLDINLENVDQTNALDRSHAVAEYTHFAENPSDGLFMLWQTLGTDANATDPVLPDSLVTYLARTASQWLPDKLDARVAALAAFLGQTDPSGKSRVIYFHCDCGCDRTGEMAGAWWLKQSQMQFADIISMNTQIAGRPMLCNNYRALQWYCLFVNAIYGHTQDCVHVQDPCMNL